MKHQTYVAGFKHGELKADTCQGCGSLVVDHRLHDAWHRALPFEVRHFVEPSPWTVTP